MKASAAVPCVLTGFEESWRRLDDAQHALGDVEREARNDVPLVALRYEDLASFETSVAVLSDSVTVRITPHSGSPTDLHVLATTDLLVVRMRDGRAEHLVRLPAPVDAAVSVVDFRNGSMTVTFSRRFDGPVVIWCPNGTPTGDDEIRGTRRPSRGGRA
jgi:hypothetical protein